MLVSSEQVVAPSLAEWHLQQPAKCNFATAECSKGCGIKYFGAEWDVLELELGNVDKCKPAQFDLPTDN